MEFIGVDLARGEGSDRKAANESGVSQNKPKDDQEQSSRVPRATGRWMHQKQKTSGDHAS